MTKQRQQLIHKKRWNLNGSLPADIINNACIFLVHLYKLLRLIECEKTTETFTFSKSLLAIKCASCTAISLLCYMTFYGTKLLNKLSWALQTLFAVVQFCTNIFNLTWKRKSDFQIKWTIQN